MQRSQALHLFLGNTAKGPGLALRKLRLIQAIHLWAWRSHTQGFESRPHTHLDTLIQHVEQASLEGSLAPECLSNPPVSGSFSLQECWSYRRKPLQLASLVVSRDWTWVSRLELFLLSHIFLRQVFTVAPSRQQCMVILLPQLSKCQDYRYAPQCMLTVKCKKLKYTTVYIVLLWMQTSTTPYNSIIPECFPLYPSGESGNHCITDLLRW